MAVRIVILLSVLLGLVIFGVSLGPVLVTSMSLILALTFMVGNSAKNMFEGIIFLFITHPFDVGDRVFIGNLYFELQHLMDRWTKSYCQRTWHLDYRISKVQKARCSIRKI
jgi:small-conductance mechanosensitive channel